MPIITYLNRKRMEIAARLPASTSVTDTAKQTGFLSIYSFSRAFKNRWGLSPAEYRKQMTK